MFSPQLDIKYSFCLVNKIRIYAQLHLDRHNDGLVYLVKVDYSQVSEVTLRGSRFNASSIATPNLSGIFQKRPKNYPLHLTFQYSHSSSYFLT
jgi:hypothetical protein